MASSTPRRVSTGRPKNGFHYQRVLKSLQGGAHIEYRPFVQPRQGTRFHMFPVLTVLVHGERREGMELSTFNALRRRGLIVFRERHALYNVWGPPPDKSVDWTEAWRHFEKKPS